MAVAARCDRSAGWATPRHGRVYRCSRYHFRGVRSLQQFGRARQAVHRFTCRARRCAGGDTSRRACGSRLRDDIRCPGPDGNPLRPSSGQPRCPSSPSGGRWHPLLSRRGGGVQPADPGRRRGRVRIPECGARRGRHPEASAARHGTGWSVLSKSRACGGSSRQRRTGCRAASLECQCVRAPRGRPRRSARR
jgi:hypothetical protein